MHMPKNVTLNAKAAAFIPHLLATPATYSNPPRAKTALSTRAPAFTPSSYMTAAQKLHLHVQAAIASASSESQEQKAGTEYPSESTAPMDLWIENQAGSEDDMSAPAPIILEPVLRRSPTPPLAVTSWTILGPRQLASGGQARLQLRYDDNDEEDGALSCMGIYGTDVELDSGGTALSDPALMPAKHPWFSQSLITFQPRHLFKGMLGRGKIRLTLFFLLVASIARRLAKATRRRVTRQLRGEE
jgi:hypothetical protein